jgi:3-methyl-2-oxobutanoate hydroxymethyltransferase
MRKSIQDIQDKKKRGEKIVMLTAYDYPTAQLVDQADVDMILVGDSLANVVLGLESTRDVGMMEMIHHSKAVNRAVKNALLVGDMPFESYQQHPSKAVDNARRFIQEAGCNAVKLEWFQGCLNVAQAIHHAGIAVMGHVGLTPQTADQAGGFKVQGREAESALGIMKNAKALEDVGCFSVVLECIPLEVSKIITQKLSIPTIGIGAGPDCDGQVLVTHDMVGFFDRYKPKFVKQYLDLGSMLTQCVSRFKQEVRNGQYPDMAHSYSMNPQELEQLKSKKV